MNEDGNNREERERDPEEDVCPVCGGQTSREWQGYLVVIDYTKSDIAKKMGITSNGKFALRVR